MSKAITIGDRMKTFYEGRTQQFLPRRINAIIRLDGVSFKSFTRGLKRPYDVKLIEAMNQTAIALCSQIQGVKAAFVQSDEISLIITDYDTRDTSAWYDYNVQKMVSVSAAIATAAFNKHFQHPVVEKQAYFDSRVFAISDWGEVVNYFQWRQQDCTRNSISACAQALYSHKELEGVGGSALQDLIFLKGEELKQMMFVSNAIPLELLEKEHFNWNDVPADMKRGRLVTHEAYTRDSPKHGPVTRYHWVANAAPIFSENRDVLNVLNPFAIVEVVEEEDIVAEKLIKI